MWINIISAVIAGASLTFDIIIHRKQSKLHKSIQEILNDKQLQQQFIDCTNTIAGIKMKAMESLHYNYSDIEELHNVVDMLLRFESWSYKEKRELEENKKLFSNYVLTKAASQNFPLDEHQQITIRLNQTINLMKKRGIKL